MNNKDLKTLQEAYSQISPLKEQFEDDNTFFAENVEVDIFDLPSDIADMSSNSKTNVKYSIQIEYRNWGIKGIEIGRIINIDPITIEIARNDENLTPAGEITINPMEAESIEVEAANGKSVVDDYGQVFPTRVEVHMGNSDKPKHVLVSF